jgi:hypothetical protein
VTTPKKISIPYGFKPREYQKDLLAALNSGYKRALLKWARQLGKDTTCFAYMCQQAASVPGNYFYIFPTKEEARRAVWEKVLEDGTRLIDFLPNSPDLGLVRRRSNQEMVIELFNNSTIRLIGVDKDPDAARGITPMGVVFSEFAFTDPEAYIVMLPALKRKGCWCIINSTPDGRNHFYDLYESYKNDKNWYVSEKQCLYSDVEGYVHVYEQEYFKQLIDSKAMAPEEVERDYGCSFATAKTGAIFAADIDNAKINGRIRPVNYNPEHPVCTFWDLGVDDATAIWFMQRIKDVDYFIDYLEVTGAGFDDIVETCIHKEYKLDMLVLPHDAGHRQQGRSVQTKAELLREAFNAAGVTIDIVVNERISKNDGIELLKQKLKTAVFDSNNCVEGIDHLSLYHRKYDKRRKVYQPNPNHDKSSHAADALRMYALYDYIPKNETEHEIKVLHDFDVWT